MSVVEQINCPSHREKERAMSHPAYSALSSEYRNMPQEQFSLFFLQILARPASDEEGQRSEETNDARPTPKVSPDPRGEALKYIPRHLNSVS